MSYQKSNPNGQATMANSAPVTIASNQSTVKTKLATDIADTTGSITSAASVVTMTDLSGVGSVTVTIYGAAHAGVNATFEAYDGVNWVALPAQPHNSITPAPVLATGVLTANSTNRYNVSPLLGASQFRVRATAWTSGTASVIIEASAQFVQYLVNVATMPAISGSVTNTPLTPTAFTLNSAATTNATLVKATAGTLHQITASNVGAAAAFLKIYNLTTAPTVGTSVPVLTIPIPAAGVQNINFANLGMRLGTGISIAITNLAPDTDTTVIAASQVKVLISYV